MPACMLCNVIKTRLDARNLCADCRTLEDQNAGVDNLLETAIATQHDLDTPCDITIRQMLQIVQKAMAITQQPLSEKIDGISTKIDNLHAEVAENAARIAQLRTEYNNQKADVTMMTGEIESLKKVILKQQEYLETCKRKDLQGNIIVSGIPKANLTIGDDVFEENDTKTAAVLDFIGCRTDPTTYELYAIPGPDDRDAQIKLKFKDHTKIDAIMTNAKKLKNLENFRIFIKRDEPYHTRKENARLRKRRYDLSRVNINDNIKIDKGKLYHNDMIVDKFDLNNQIF